MHCQMNEISIPDLRAEADAMTAKLPDGEPLDEQAAALVALALAVSVTSLDRGAVSVSIHAAMEAGATVAQVQEVIALVSGLGVHSLMASSVAVLGEAAAALGVDEFRFLFAAAAPAFSDDPCGLHPAHCQSVGSSGRIRSARPFSLRLPRFGVDHGLVE
mgnify:CR=1 FL=1